jgi:hypothetical protein
MPKLPKDVDPNALPDLAHYRAQGIARLTAWCPLKRRDRGWSMSGRHIAIAPEI